jgi:hypothetical protein
MDTANNIKNNVIDTTKKTLNKMNNNQIIIIVSILIFITIVFGIVYYIYSILRLKVLLELIVLKWIYYIKIIRL